MIADEIGPGGARLRRRFCIFWEANERIFPQREAEFAGSLDGIVAMGYIRLRNVTSISTSARFCLVPRSAGGCADFAVIKQVL
jgi:hypothetical protein